MRLRLAALGLIVLYAGNAQADKIDDLIKAEMQQRKIPGLSIAIIEGGKIIKAAAYGVTEQGSSSAVTTETLFQAGSVSKSVAALGALHLVEQGKLALDDDVNTRLVSWKVPENVHTAAQKVTLRGLLSHSAGMTVHGFPGYATDAPMPTLIQILNGVAPANTAPIRVDMAPGSKWRYSGGGYTVMQLMMSEVSGKAFPELMQQTVLAPLGMASSSFAQPPGAPSATGHYPDRTRVAGRWHLYPEMAAAGLWTTASDLARFAVGVQAALAGTANPVISAAMTRTMLTEHKDGDGLGLFVRGSGPTLAFSHGGRDEGFDTRLHAFAGTGQGVAIMINANDNSKMMDRIVMAVGRQYHWPDAEPAPLAGRQAVQLDAATLASYAGRYEMANNQMVALRADQGRLVSLVDGMPDEVFIPVGKQQLASDARKATLSFTVNAQGEVTGALVDTGRGAARQVARIGPLMHSVTASADPQLPGSAGMAELVAALARGGDAISASTRLTAGMKHDLGTGKVRELEGLAGMALMLSQDVSGRPLERHGSKVAQVLSYKVTVSGQPQFLLLYLTGERLLTDYDLVQD